MAARKPLVIVSGQIQQLQSGDTLANVESGIVSLTNDNAGSIVIGAPVYSSSTASVDVAQADAIGTADVIGLVADTSIASAAAGNIQTNGILTATTGQWDTITGDAGGLTFNTTYFLDPDNVGKLTDTAPSLDGDVVTRVGKALSTTQMKIDIQPPILL